MLTVNGCSDDTNLVREIQSLNSRFLIAIASGIDACKQFAQDLEVVLRNAREKVYSGIASPELSQAFTSAAGPLDAICTMLTNTETQRETILQEQEVIFGEVLARHGLRRRRKRTTRSRKSKTGKTGKVRQSGKKSKRGRKSPVGNAKRRVQDSTKQGRKSENSKKSRNVTAPPTDSMKFGPCRDFFLSHLGDPYPTTVQKHQILKQSSPDFTLRSLNLWFVNIRRRSKWMDIFKKHAGSKRDAMRDLVARVEAQVAGRPTPNPLPSGAAPPGCKVDQGIVEEVMAMRAIVDMVSREVYGEGWDQILQIKPWSDEEVRAHEERKKAARRLARESKVDGEKRKRERDEHKLKRQRDRDQRKRIEQEAIDGIRAARELHAKLMAMNKRKRDDEEASEGSSKRRRSKDTDLDENLEPKKRKIKVPKFDDMGNPLTKEQRKAIKRAMLAEMQANPLKRKSPEPQGIVPQFNDSNSPSKRRRRDAVTFDGFPAPGDSSTPAEAEPMTDLSQLFTMEWASPSSAPAPLPSTQESPPVVAPRPGYGGFALPTEPEPPAPSSEVTSQEAVEQPRRFSQQLAAFALESGMFDNQNFELFTTDTFPGMEVDVHSNNSMPAPPSEGIYGPGINGVSDFGANAPQPLHLNTNTSVSNSMSVSPIPSQIQTPMQSFATPTQHHVPSFEFAQPDHQSQQSHEPNGYADSSQHSNADSSDMSWLNAALEHLPSQHDVARMNNAPQFPHGGEFSSQLHPQTGFPAQYGSHHEPQFESRPSTAVSDWHNPVHSDRITQVQPQAQQRMQFASTSSPSTPMPPQQRPIFPQPQPQAKPSVSQPQPQPQPQARASSSHLQPQSKQRALWQTPQSQPSQQRYPTPGPSYQQQQQQQQYHAPPPHSFPATATPQYAHQPTPQPQQSQPYAPPSYGERSPEQHRVPPPPTDAGSYGQRYQSASYQEAHPQPSPSPAEPKILLKDREAEFARAQEALQAQFRREQEEQLARFMRAQEELRNQLLGSGPGRAS
ncbi:hypothetical protein B0J17DRAFT_725878 [Rhizoctonia solani]|nr:hypothetical protein B0J17DRAFT_725878 [Rhizoctonia solani]